MNNDRDKRLRFDANKISSYSDSDSIYVLNEQFAFALHESLRQMSWATRWDNATDDFIREFVGELGDRLMNSNDICELIAHCISDSTSVQNAIENYLQSQSKTVATLDTRIDALENIAMTSHADDLCDDRRFSGIRAVIERLDINSVDFLENASDDVTDIFARVDIIIEAVPIFGQIADIVTDFAIEYSTDALNEYETQSTLTLREQIACDVFCNTVGCTVTIDDFINAYTKLLPQSIPELILSSATELIRFVMTGNVVGSAYFAFINLIQLYIIKLKEHFFGMSDALMIVEFLRGSNSPDITHSLLCIACIPCVNLTVIDYGELVWLKDERRWHAIAEQVTEWNKVSFTHADGVSAFNISTLVQASYTTQAAITATLADDSVVGLTFNVDYSHLDFKRIDVLTKGTGVYINCANNGV